MNNIYYSKFNKKGYFNFGLSLVGLLLIHTNNLFALMVILIVTTILFDGVLSKDIIVSENNNLYLISKRSNNIINIAYFVFLFIAFALCVGNKYLMGLLIVFLIYIVLFIRNMIVSHRQEKFCSNIENINNLLKRKNFDYFVYKVEDVEVYDKKRYLVSLVDKFDKESHFKIVYTLDKFINNYGEVRQLFNSLIKENSR